MWVSVVFIVMVSLLLLIRDFVDHVSHYWWIGLTVSCVVVCFLVPVLLYICVCVCVCVFVCVYMSVCVCVVCVYVL